MTPATMLEHDGVKQSIAEWALDYGITPAIIIGRLERGEAIANAITAPMKVGHRRQRLPIYSRKQMASPQRHGQNSNSERRSIGTTYRHDGRWLTIAEWSDVTGLKIVTIRARLYAGWDIGRALSAPTDRNGRDCEPGPGVSSDFAPFEGTGGGRHAQESAQISFSSEG